MTTSRKSQNWLPSIFNDFLGNEWIAKSATAAPAMNIIENSKEYKIEIASPGLQKEDFSVKINDQNHLVISVRHSEEKKEGSEDERFLRREFSLSQFKQTLILPDNIDKDKIVATQQNGILSVSIPKQDMEVVTTERVVPIG
ncbi:MAG: Hsp20/alpha crystallin family protein [Rikenellaceae bacterium]